MRLRRLAARAACAACAAAPLGAQAPTPPAPDAATPAPAPAPQDTAPRRPRAVEVGDGYARRLAVHRWGSYAVLPVFAAQYVLGDRLLDQKEDAFAGRRATPPDGALRTWHGVTAGTVGALFAANTVTGMWNLVESRGTPGGGRRAVHATAMLLADAGFVATGVLGSRATDRAVDDARRHRAVALGSMGVAAAGALFMWLTRD